MKYMNISTMWKEQKKNKNGSLKKFNSKPILPNITGSTWCVNCKLHEGFDLP